MQRAVAQRCYLRATDGAERPLTELGLAAAPLAVKHLSSTRSSGWRPRLVYRDKEWQGKEIEELANVFQGLRFMNDTTAETLRRALNRLDDDGALDLTGERFALFGAGAEIAPTRALLEAGATVMWTDVVPPPKELLELGGELYHASGRSDLLLRPDEVAATMAEFARAGPIHIGLFAYGPGQGREWRLGAAMNAALRALPRELVRSVGLLVSPTTPMVLDRDDAAVSTRRWEERPGWQKALLAARVVIPARSHPDLPQVADTIVPLQGVSYQAAQWLEKTVAMEAIRADNPDLPISANVAPVTKT
ncbi:MAG: hypothetical protein AAF658_14095, partial [Myxococcota bacterium]